MLREHTRGELLMKLKSACESCVVGDPGFLFRESSVGLSYIIPSESKQEGCEGYERLPPITIRPIVQSTKQLQDVSAIKKYAKIFQSGKTMAVSFLNYDEHASKEYLLFPSRRMEFVEANKGQLSFESAFDGLLEHAVEKGFVCFHYQLKRDRSGHLFLDAIPESKFSIENSNIQLAISMKRGVGGTSGMKAESRLLDKGGMLGLLLGEDPQSLLDYYNELNTAEGDTTKIQISDVVSQSLIPAEKKMALTTLCCRVDLYLDRTSWDTLTQMEICNLVCATREFGKDISAKMRQKNWQSHMDSLKALSVERNEKSYPEHMGEIFQHAGALLDDVMGTLDGRDPMDPSTKQQFFLKMHVCCLALSAPRQKHPLHTPLYMVSTRDCFTSDIVGEDALYATGTDSSFIKTRWFIWNKDVPMQFDSVMENLLAGTESHSIEAMILDGIISTIVHSEKKQSRCKGYLLPLGVTTYNGVYDSQDLESFESSCDSLHETALHGILPKECYHASASKKGSLKRTKYFFGSRYLWNREQLKSPHAKVAGGIRHDVPEPPGWMKEVVMPMVSAKLVPDGFVDAIALNMYHDGSEGIQSHYDDSKRFHQPIYSLRLFSDSRLSFGTQLYGFTNGLFFIPMPRGCITVMENFGFAANGVKHCVRPIDMTGKSAAMILRKINEDALKKAEELFWKEILEKLKHLSLAPVSPEQLIWNPLYDDVTATLDDTALHLRETARKQRLLAKEEKAIKAVMHSMLGDITRRERSETQNKRKIFYIMSGMTKRICTAERIGIDISQNSNYEIFNVMDDVISFCEYPTHLRGKKRRRKQGCAQNHSIVRTIEHLVNKEE
jgi:hypothetical protein